MIVDYGSSFVEFNEDNNVRYQAPINFRHWILGIRRYSIFTVKDAELFFMRTHQLIDERSLMLARAVAGRIDRDQGRKGLDQARAVCRKWLDREDNPAIRRWWNVLHRPWEKVRQVLLDESEYGREMRQNTPFCGILSPRERWEIYRKFGERHETSRT